MSTSTVTDNAVTTNHTNAYANNAMLSKLRTPPTLLQLYWKLDPALQTIIRLYVMSYGTQITRAIKELVAAENKEGNKVKLVVGEDTMISLWSANIINKKEDVATFQLCLSASWRSMIIKCDLEIALYSCKLRNLEAEKKTNSTANNGVQDEDEHTVRTSWFFEGQLYYYINLQTVYFKKHMDVLENLKLQSPTAKLIAIAKLRKKYNLNI